MGDRASNLIIAICCFLCFIELATISTAKIITGYDRHHIFPQQEKMRPYFLQRNIEPHMWVIFLPEKIHDRLNRRWDVSWKSFIAAQPYASREEVFLFAGSLIVSEGIQEYAEHIVDNNGNDTDNKLPLSQLKANIQAKTELLLGPVAAQSLKVAANPVSIASYQLAFEVYSAISSLDEDFRNNSYVKMAIDEYCAAEESFNAGQQDIALQKMGRANYYLGYACFSKAIEYRSDFSKEIASAFSAQDRRYFELAEIYFLRALDLDATIPYARFHLGMTERQLGRKDAARADLLQSLDAFKKANDEDFIAVCYKELELLK